ncbi:preprotein translocase subunit SecD [Sphingomonas jejuensis]|uniref:Protein translocase subunit SecD n=1 Tax=Sphingomonas jejuensis TaxID=904715 RepID=A0ABX0XMQ8_9SPHN|nr:protein translocase subunit SecD [Sphingomonas jejuensis]NJC34478.1 preprotein translocase subunit SecD [Sphingomonas jejuensis]
MLDFPRWKMWLVWATVIIGVLAGIPSLLPDRARQALPAWMPAPVVNLGLDLAGGSYILLEAQVDDIARQRLQLMEETIRTEMRRQQPRIDIGEISTRGGQLSFFVRNPAEVDGAVERLRALTQGVGVTGQRDWQIAVVDTNRVTVTPTEAGLDAALDNAMAVATDIVRRRIDELGTREPTIIRQGATRIVVQVPGLQDPQQLKDLLGQTARLEFKLVDINADPQAVAAGRAPIGGQILPYPPENGGPGNLAVRRQVMVAGDELVDAQQTFDQQTNAPVVTIRFNSSGGRKFARVTQENTGRPFAIILDNEVISAPNINEPILGGSAQISGNFTVESANQLAIALRSGQLPVELQVIEESTISPELGQDSIERGVVAGVIGTAAVVLLMLFAYLRFGVYANIALVVNVLMIIGVMAIMDATLTLPGIAGFVLTIGAAVDANVLINERIREEQRRGRTINGSVEFGYKEASRAILDANITNVIAAVIMFIFGAGPVRGFAVVLTIGIVTSVFTAVTFTRLLVARWLKTRPKQLVI